MALNIDDFRTLVLVAKEQSVSRAAQRMGVTQQSVSERIKRLERRLNKQFFVRQSHGMKLSPEGYTLVPYATKIVSLVDESIAAINNEGVLRVLIQHSVDATIEPLRSHIITPHTSLVGADSAEEILSAVSHGEADVAIGDFVEPPSTPSHNPQALPAADDSSSGANGAGPHAPAGEVAPDDTLPPEELIIETLFTDPVVWVASPRHPFAERSSISLEEINEISHSATDEESVRVSPRSVVARQIASGEVVELPVNRTRWVIPISIAYRSLDRDRPGVVVLRNALIEAHELTVADLAQQRHRFTEIRR